MASVMSPYHSETDDALTRGESTLLLGSLLVLLTTVILLCA